MGTLGAIIGTIIFGAVIGMLARLALPGKQQISALLTVALGVFRSQTPAGSPDWAGLMAATLVAAVPVLILFFMFARKIIDSIGYSGSK